MIMRPYNKYHIKDLAGTMGSTEYAYDIFEVIEKIECNYHLDIVEYHGTLDCATVHCKNDEHFTVRKVKE